MSLKYDRKKIEVFQNRLGYRFKEISLLITALTHSSYANESKKHIAYNERMEFLGDAVLDMVISDYLYHTYPDLPEGQLTKVRALVVSEPSLAEIGYSLDVGEFLFLGRGEDSTGGRKRRSIIADAVESIIAAIYIDGGISVANQIILKYFTTYIKKAVNGDVLRDYKTQLQEVLQSYSNREIKYRTEKELGPDHAKLFVINVIHGSHVIGTGEGKSKKEAEQMAAKHALDNIKSK